MGLFGKSESKASEDRAARAECERFLRDLNRPVSEAVQVLEHAGLVEVLGTGRGSVATGAHVRATRAGEAALARGEKISV